MTWSFSLGRLFGSEVRVHVTFFLLLAWVGMQAYSGGGWPAVTDNLIFVLALFACVVAHEFGHALMARRYGIRTPDITLLPFGGLARLERMPNTPMHEIWVALAGPAVNVLIWVVLVIFGAGLPFTTLTRIDPAHIGLLDRLAYVNLLLAGFNMIPAFPMDGGRVFRALLCLRLDRVNATRIATLCGQVLAVGLGLFGLYVGNPFLVMIAVFVFFAASAENRDAARRSVAQRVLAQDIMISRYRAFSPDDTIGTAIQAALETKQHAFPLLAPSGALLGFVTRQALLAKGTSDALRSRPVSCVMETKIPHVAHNAPLDTVIAAFHSGASVVAVFDQTGHMIGYVTRETIDT